METTQVHADDRERGQIIVLFALALVAIVAMVGLVLDGGSAYAQRRGEQNAADLAALAGANDYLVNGNSAQAIVTARAVAAQNGYTQGANGVSVNVTVTTSNGATVQVDVSSPHANNFASIVGMPTWKVSTTATALASRTPDTANGAAPFIFSIDAFGTNGLPLPAYGDPNNPFGFGGCGDAPQAATDFAWTDYAATANVNTSIVRNIIDGSVVITKTVQYGTYIGQHNQGCHTALYSPVDTYLDGKNVPVPVVDHSGNFQGWATFHVVSAQGGRSKVINGYFVSPFVNSQLTVGGSCGTSCPTYLGSYDLKLTN